MCNAAQAERHTWPRTSLGLGEDWGRSDPIHSEFSRHVWRQVASSTCCCCTDGV